MSGDVGTRSAQQLVAWLACIALVACSSPAAHPQIRDGAWLAAALDRPAGDAGRECLESSLNTSYALIAFRFGHVSDDKVREYSLKNIPAADPGLHDLRSAEATEWAHSHDPSAASRIHLAGCLARADIVLTQTSRLQSCLRATEPAAALAVSRADGSNERDAVARTVKIYGGFAPGAASIQDLADTMYAMPTDSESLHFRASLFSRCFTTSEKS